MSQPYVGECKMVGFNFPPVSWMMCAGQILPISQYELLFALIGTTFGGDGQSTFQLPDLRGRVPIHQGTVPGGPVFTLGQPGGTEQVTLNQQQLPAHTHALMASNTNGTSNQVQGAALAVTTTRVYRATSPNPTSAMNSNAITTVGGSLPHENRQPYLAINWVISLFGIFPSPS